MSRHVEPTVSLRVRRWTGGDMTKDKCVGQRHIRDFGRTSVVLQNDILMHKRLIETVHIFRENRLHPSGL